MALIAALLVAGCAAKPSAPEARSLPPPPPSGSRSADTLMTGSIDPAPALPGVRSDRMSVADLVSHVLATNPDVLIAEARVRDQVAGVDFARAAYNPSIDVSASMGPEVVYTLREEGQVMPRKEVGVTLRQHVYDFGIIRNDVRRAALARDAAVSRKAGQSETTVEETIAAVLSVLELDDLLRVAQANVAAHQEILALIETNEANGNASVADTKRVTTRLEQAKTALIDLTTNRSDAEDAFRRLTDLDIRMIDGRPLLRLTGSAIVDPAVLEAHPAIRALQDEVASLRAQIDSVRAERLPVVDVEADAKLRDDVGAFTAPGVTAKAMVNLRSKIWDGGLGSAQERQLQARVDETLLKLDKARRELKEQAENAARITESGSEKKAALLQRLEASRKVAELQMEQFRDGAVTLFELLDSQAERSRAEAEAITAAFVERRAVLKSLALSGRLVASLSVPPGVR